MHVNIRGRAEDLLIQINNLCTPLSSTELFVTEHSEPRERYGNGLATGARRFLPSV